MSESLRAQVASAAIESEIEVSEIVKALGESGKDAAHIDYIASYITSPKAALKLLTFALSSKEVWFFAGFAGFNVCYLLVQQW